MERVYWKHPVSKCVLSDRTYSEFEWQPRPIEDALRAENERMRKALEFYADPVNWKYQEVTNDTTKEIMYFSAKCKIDDGDKAREALKGGDK